MQQKFKDKYRVESIRLPNRDYASNGWYFVTICTNNRQCFFGNIVDGQVEYSPIGQIAEKFWSEIPQHSKYTYIDSYVIMPNHVHGIIIIDKPDNVESQNFTSPDSDESNKFGPLKRSSLQSIIHSYKSAVTRWCRKNGQFNWSDKDNTGIAFDSSAGFKLPNGADRSPDASWVKLERWNALTPQQQTRFLPLCPHFVIELLSPSDSLKATQEKMKEYKDNDASLGWLINRKNKQVEIYRIGQEVEVLDKSY